MSEWVRESYGPEPEQFFERFNGSDSKAPLIVAIHGGYWKPEHDREHMRPLAEKIGSAGYSVVLVEYRRTSGAPDETISDIRLALAALSSPRIVVGFSAGGQLALICADLLEKNDSIIALAPVTDLHRTQVEDLGEGAVSQWLGGSAIDRSDLDPIKNPPLNIPIHILHGENDLRVPIAHSRDYLHEMKSRGVNVDLKELAGLGHFELMDASGQIVQEILALLKR